MKQFLALSLCFIATFSLVLPRVFAAGQVASSTTEMMSRTEIEDRIRARTTQLEDLNRQLKATQQSLATTKQERVHLQQEVVTLKNNIAHLTLSMKADEVSVQKLGFEMESLRLDLSDIQSSMSDKQAAIGDILRKFQVNDEANLLLTFLTSNSLADSVAEAQNLADIQSQLTVDIGRLRSLHFEYDKKLEEKNNKKEEINYHKENLAYRKLIVEDQKKEQQTILVRTQNKESIFQKQLQELEVQQQQIANEVEALDSVLRSKVNSGSLPIPRAGVLGMPLEGGKDLTTQGYGATSFAKNGYRGKWHNGLDFRASVGTPVLAAEDGRVAAAGNQDAYCPRGAYGRFVVISHNNNLTTLYSHLSRTAISAGETVKRGQVIGYSGRTGYATGPHLHFTVFASATFYMGSSKVCGPMPYGGDLNPGNYL